MYCYPDEAVELSKYFRSVAVFVNEDFFVENREKELKEFQSRIDKIKKEIYSNDFILNFTRNVLSESEFDNMFTVNNFNNCIGCLKLTSDELQYGEKESN